MQATNGILVWLKFIIPQKDLIQSEKNTMTIFSITEKTLDKLIYFDIGLFCWDRSAPLSKTTWMDFFTLFPSQKGRELIHASALAMPIILWPWSSIISVKGKQYQLILPKVRAKKEIKYMATY